MFVGRIMHTDLVTAPPDTSLARAKEMLDEKEIDHLLVLDKQGKLTGIVSDRDLKQSWASPATSLSRHELSYILDSLTVDMIMVKKIITITAATTIERAALIMQEHRINALPVMEDETLIGIITSTDVMGVLLEANGIDDDSTRFVVMVTDRIGSIAEVSRILKDQKINIRSIFSYPEKKYPGVFQLVMRVSASNGDKAIAALTEGGFKVLTDYVEDVSAYLPDK